MKKVLILFICFFFTNCGSRKVDKKASKEEKRIELSESKQENIEELEFSKKEVQIDIEEFEFSIFENFNINYEGLNPNDSIELKKTKDGWVAKGAGKLNFRKNKETNNKNKTTKQNEIDSVVKAKESTSDSKINLSANFESENLDKKTEKTSTNLFSWIGGLVLFVSAAYSGYLVYKRLKKP